MIINIKVKGQYQKMMLLFYLNALFLYSIILIFNIIGTNAI